MCKENPAPWVLIPARQAAPAEWVQMLWKQGALLSTSLELGINHISGIRNQWNLEKIHMSMHIVALTYFKVSTSIDLLWIGPNIMDLKGVIVRNGSTFMSSIQKHSIYYMLSFQSVSLSFIDPFFIKKQTVPWKYTVASKWLTMGMTSIMLHLISYTLCKLWQIYAEIITIVQNTFTSIVAREKKGVYLKMV